MRDVTYALLRPETAPAAVEALRGTRDRAGVEGLVELLYRPSTARLAVAAIEALADCPARIVLDVLYHSLSSEHASVRAAAIEALRQRDDVRKEGALARLLEGDPSWPVRRAALAALAAMAHPGCWRVLSAATDPHWRVRHALIQALLRWGQTDQEREEIEQRLAGLEPSARVRGVCGYLRYRWTGEPLAVDPAEPTPEAIHSWQWWDWDAAVLLRNLERLGEAGRRRELALLPPLLAHSDSRVSGVALGTLRDWGEPPYLARAVALLDEPRNGAGEVVVKLLSGLDLDRIEDTARLILHDPGASPAQRTWALKQAERLGLPFRARVASDDPAPTDTTRARNDKQEDSHPHVRAAALTPALAAALIEEPTRETSWHVLAAAARMQCVPLWQLEPKPPWQPPPRPVAVSLPLHPNRSAPAHARRLGPDGLEVSRVGISGHYGLPVDGFVRAVEAGVNLLFWEPNYQTLTEFAARLPTSERNALHFLAGTFEADGKRVRRDAERALRLLKIDRLAIFLIFWVQSWRRIAPDVRETLEALQTEGKVATFGLSTHSRPLAVEAMETGWDPVMVRHSAAHRGAEERVLPRAVELGTSVITFNNTCYGRLLQPHADSALPSAADCYRYTLAQPGVTVCLSAPATLPQLDENLTALHDPLLPEERQGALRAHGNAVYREDATFRKFVRSR